MENLYLVALCRDRGIRSIRDLRARHLSLLRGMRDQIIKVTLERFNVPGHQLRLFFHYQPTYCKSRQHLSCIKYLNLVANY
jgi:m7GpppX diphosphatase